MVHRPSVAGIVQDATGRILIGERIDFPGSWQFPQGGMDPGETREQALQREMLEEISLEPDHYEIVAVKGPYRYRFPEGRMKRGFRGQSHHYFLLRLTIQKSRVNVAVAHPEFQRVRWIHPHEFQLEWLPPMKRRAYGRLFRDFFGIKLTSANNRRPER
jgi:putative (di)nucleoside polyphosphate hydrolase